MSYSFSWERGREWLGNGFLEKLAFEDETSRDVHSWACREPPVKMH